MNPGTKIVDDVLTKFPNSPILTLAKKIYTDNPLVFPSLEAARGAIRYLKGQMPPISKKTKKIYSPRNKAHIKPKEFKYNPFKLPESHADSYEPYIIYQTKTLIISDLHFPYQDNQAITCALNYGLEKKVNCILINGDLIDFATISRHEKDWRHRSVAEEFEAVRVFFKSLREAFPNVKIVVKNGNHELRWEKWLYVKAPEIFDCSDFQLDVLFRFGELKIDYVSDKRPITIGKLTVLHGHELPGMGGVNPARATFLKTLDSVLVGHYHRTSSHVETTMNGNTISVNSTGCLCGLHPDYMPINKHNLGFAYCELDIKSGEYMLENLKIIKGKIYK